MTGLEWILEAFDCDPASLRDRRRIAATVDAMVAGMDLHPVGEPVWHQFEGSAGITGLVLLAESHLAIHTFPEHCSVTLNLFCCRPRPDWDFRGHFERELGARHVCLRKLERRYARDGA